MTPDETIIVADRHPSMKAVLTELGYDIWKVPLQIPCPVHKMGEETRPSARIYEDDKTIWCFFCVTQYRPTEVWGAMRRLDRIDAARAILRRWPVDEAKAGEILRRARVPVQVRLPDVYYATLERHLVDHRGQADFEEYRKWCKAVDDFNTFLRSIPQQSQEVTIVSFIERMNAALTESYLRQVVYQ